MPDLAPLLDQIMAQPPATLAAWGAIGVLLLLLLIAGFKASARRRAIERHLARFDPDLGTESASLREFGDALDEYMDRTALLAADYEALRRRGAAMPAPTPAEPPRTETRFGERVRAAALTIPAMERRALARDAALAALDEVARTARDLGADASFREFDTVFGLTSGAQRARERLAGLSETGEALPRPLREAILDGAFDAPLTAPGLAAAYAGARGDWGNVAAALAAADAGLRLFLALHGVQADRVAPLVEIARGDPRGEAGDPRGLKRIDVVRTIVADAVLRLPTALDLVVDVIAPGFSAGAERLTRGRVVLYNQATWM